MSKNELSTDSQSEIEQLLALRFTTAEFTLLENSAQANDLSPVMQIYNDHLLDMGFIYSHEIIIHQGIGKSPEQPSRMLAYLDVKEKAYAILTDLYHQKSWVYFTHYFARNEQRIITTCQPGALQLEAMRELSSTAGFTLVNTGSATLASQWKRHLQLLATQRPDETSLLMDANQHLDTERDAYLKYSELLLDCTILRQSDTQLVGFTQTGVRNYYAAITSLSARRPKPKVEEWIGKSGKIKPASRLNHRSIALTASAAVFALLVYNVATYSKLETPAQEKPIATLPDDTATAEQPELAAAAPTEQRPVEPPPVIDIPDRAALNANSKNVDTQPEQFVLASDEDEMWRIAVENAEFYLMSNDGDPAPWIRTARKMAAGFKSSDPRLARTYFLAALLERDPMIAEQQYNRALSIQTKSLGLYHAETAQTLEALAWIAEGSRDALEDAITHQRLALNIYRSVFGDDAEDTRAARWKLEYFQDRLAGRRPKSDENRRLLPALARFTR